MTCRRSDQREPGRPVNRTSGRSALRGLANVLRSRRAQTSTEPWWRVDIGNDGVTILLTVTDSPEWSSSTTLPLNTEAATQLALELKSAARATAGRLSAETFVPGQIVGMKLSDAAALLRVLGLTVTMVDAATGEERPSASVVAGHRVTAVEPPAETVLRRGSSVRLSVAPDP